MRLIHDDADVVSMCKLHVGGPRDTIILYVESDMLPLQLKFLEGLVEGLVEGVMIVWW